MNCKVQLKKSKKVVECRTQANQTVKSVIEYVKNSLEIPPQTKGTIFKDSEKCDELKTINELGIQEDSFLEMELNLPYQLVVKHDIFSERKLKVNAFERVLDLAEKINSQYRIKRYSIGIWFNNKLLDPNDLLYFAQIGDQMNVQCKLEAGFTIEYQDRRYSFTIDPTIKIEDVKQLVGQRIQVQNFDIYYNDRVLSGLEDKYFYYGVTQNAQLTIKVVKSVNLQIRREGTIANFTVNLDETVEKFIKYLKKIYKSVLQLKYQNQPLIPGNTIRECNLSNNSILDVVGAENKIKLTLVDFARPQLKFIDRIQSGSTIRQLYSLPQFSGKAITFFDSNRQKLNLDYVIESEKPIQLYYEEISQSQIVLQYRIRFINVAKQQEKVITVSSSDQISEHLEVDDINRVKIKYMGTEVHPEYTFKDIGCRDNDAIIYSQSDQLVRIKYEGKIHEVEVQDGTTFEQFDEILKDEFHIDRQKKYQFIYKDQLVTLQTEVLVVYNDDDLIIYRERKESVIVKQPSQPQQPSQPLPDESVSRSSQIIVEKQGPEQPKELKIFQQEIQKPKEQISLSIFVDTFDYVHYETFDADGKVELIDQYIRVSYDLGSNIFVTIQIDGRIASLNEPLYSVSPESMIVVTIDG